MSKPEERKRNGQHMITCGICFQVINKAVTLPCGESFCYDCIRSKLERNNNNGLVCTVCTYIYPELRSQDLTKHLDEKLDTYIRHLREGTYQTICQWCEEVPATEQCSECMLIYCSDCAIAAHKHSAKKNHVTGRISDAYRSYYRRCTQRDHEEYRAEFYCTQCEAMCCAYCLQVGPHKEHRHMNATPAASEARQQLVKDMQWLTKSKSRVESQCNELNRVERLYTDSYDNVENLITERFENFRQQLVQRELEVRKALSALRDSGDISMTTARKQYLVKLNGINEGTLRFACLQKSGADYEVLESRAQLGAHLEGDLPTVSGTGFKMVSLGDLVIDSLNVQLDLKTFELAAATGNMNGTQHQQQQQQQLVQQHQLQQQQLQQNGAADYAPLAVRAVSSRNSIHSVQGNNFDVALVRPLRLTFPVDEDVEATARQDGVLLRCIARGGGAGQIGVRSKEVFEKLMRHFPEDDGIVTWTVRLEKISDTFIGIVEKGGRSEVPAGFYWKPACAGVVDGQLGRITSVAQRLPVCRSGDTVRFVYDGHANTLRIVLNGNQDCGLVLTDVAPRITACFIFYPGESLTVLF